MARKDVERDLQDSEDLRAMQKQSEAAAENTVEIFHCVCGNSYAAEEWKQCPRCERPKSKANAAGEPQTGAQNL